MRFRDILFTMAAMSLLASADYQNKQKVEYDAFRMKSPRVVYSDETGEAFNKVFLQFIHGFPEDSARVYVNEIANRIKSAARQEIVGGVYTLIWNKEQRINRDSLISELWNMPKVIDAGADFILPIKQDRLEGNF